MTLKVYELHDSSSGSVTNDSESGETLEVRRRYVMGPGLLGFNDARGQAADYVPQYCTDPLGTYWRREQLGVTSLGNGWYEIEATYKTLVRKQGDDAGDEPSQTDFVPGSIAWDTTGGTEHVTQGKGQSADDSHAATGKTAANFSGAINVSGTSVQGIDITVPKFHYTETWVVAASALTTTYVGAVYRLTGKVNSATWRAFSAGEVLFLGAKAQWQGDQPYVSITFEFEAKPNTQVTIPGITAFQKKGWEYVWIDYEPSEDVNAAKVVQIPRAAYVNKLYEEGDFTTLRIGGAPGSTSKTVATPTAGAGAGAGGP
jgi:hypothetical protein